MKYVLFFFLMLLKMCFQDLELFLEGSVPFWVQYFPCAFSFLCVLINVLSESIANLSGLRASFGARMGLAARDKERDAVGQPLADRPKRAMMRSRRPDRRWIKNVHLYTKMGKVIGKYAPQKRGFLWGTRWRKGFYHALYVLLSGFLGGSQGHIGLGARADLRRCWEWSHYPKMVDINSHCY